MPARFLQHPWHVCNYLIRSSIIYLPLLSRRHTVEKTGKIGGRQRYEKPIIADCGRSGRRLNAVKRGLLHRNNLPALLKFDQGRGL